MEKQQVNDEKEIQLLKVNKTVDTCLSLTRPAAKLVAVERFLLNRCDEAQILALWRTSDDKLEDQRDLRDCCLKILRMHASSVILPRIIESWIKGFLRLIKPKLLHMFPEVTYNTLLDVLKDYDCIQHKLHAHCVVTVRPSEINILVPVWPGWKRRGKTENYPNYLRRRQKLKYKLFFYYPLVRKVIDSAYSKVPSVMAEFEKYRERKNLPLDEFIYSLKEDISIAKSIFFVGFYNDVTEFLRQPNSLGGLRGESWKKLIRLVTLIVEVQATELMRRTIENFLNILDDSQNSPKIDITLIVDASRFCLMPSEEDVVKYYQSFIDAVIQNLEEDAVCVSDAKAALMRLRLLTTLAFRYNYGSLASTVERLEAQVIPLIKAVESVQQMEDSQKEVPGEVDRAMEAMFHRILKRNPGWEEAEAAARVLQGKCVLPSVGLNPMDLASLKSCLLTFCEVRDRFKEELPALEQYVLGRSVIPPYIDVWLEQSIYEGAERKLRCIINKHFAELHTYVSDMEDVYGFINRPEHIYDEISFAATDMSYEPLMERRTFYQIYDDIFYGLSVSRFDFFLCHLFQSEAVAYLRNKTAIYKDFYTSLVLHLYEKENERIVKTYEDIKVLAETTPMNPKFLVVIGKYMLSLQPGDLMVAFKERVLRNNEILEVLMGWIDFTEEEIKFYTKGIMCYKTTLNIRKRYNKDYELHKAKFEDNLYNQSHVLSEKLETMLPKIEMFSYMNELDKLDIYKEDIHNMAAIFKMYEDEIAEVNEEEALLDIPISGFPEYDELRSSIYPMTKLITYVDLWKTMEKKWIDGTFEDLEATSVEITSQNIEKMIKHYQKMIRDLITQQTEAGNQRRIAGSVDDPATLAGPLKICEKVLARISRFNKKIIYISTLCNKSLRLSHWMEMKAITGLDLRPNSGTTLRKILKLNIGPYIERLQLISLGATEEAKLLMAYHQTQEDLAAATFQLTKDKEEEMMILTGLDDLQVELDNHILKMQIISGSAFAKPYAELYKEWTDKLILMNANLEIWNKVQSQWMYLLPVFSTADVPASLRKEKALFKAVDSFVKNVVREISNSPSVVKFAGQAQLLKDSQLMYESLCNITASMDEYINDVRLLFPRFFLITNEEIMDILTHAKDPSLVKPYLNKCFGGMRDLNIDGNKNIISFLSAEGEEVFLKTLISIKEHGNIIEKWMAQLEVEMRSTLKEVMRESVIDYPLKERTEWLQCWPAQVVMCVSQVYWTAFVSEKFKRNVKWKAVESELVHQLSELIAMVQDSTSALLRKTVCTLIIIDVHLLNVAEETFITEMSSLADFQWLSRLRHYWESDELCVKIVHASLPYGYEYMGNPSCLVKTPLTDRCFHTIMGAYHLQLYASLCGPPATGKTETAKELARALGVQCILFNCSKDMDCVVIGKLFKGVAATGAWLCLDEFERINPRVLSVITQQMSSILNAIKEKAAELVLQGTNLVFNPLCYICITMTTGRRDRDVELPENVKAFFRPTAVVTPDIPLVAEVGLVSHGFSNARELAWKLVSFHSFCATQLSSQYHYDFGMRSIKETVSAAGDLKFQFPSENESALMLRSIKEICVTKLTYEDVLSCEKIITKLFPGIEIYPNECEQILNIVKEVSVDMRLLPVEPFMENILQINQVMNLRHGFMVIGDSMSGKTTSLRVLLESLNRLSAMEGQKELPVVFEVVNPKSVTLEQLYGAMDSILHEWKDGIIPKTLRNFVSNEAVSKRKWIIFDGPIDDTWMESLHTVLDENRKLCLSSGEVIFLASHTSIVFEVMSLSQASPSVVSRCGMIYLSPDSLGWSTLVEAWICYNEDEWWHQHKSLLLGLFEWTLIPCIQFIRKHGKQIIHTRTENIARSIIKIMDMFLCDSEKTNDKKTGQAWLQGLYVFACVWGVGGILDSDSMQTFDEFIKTLVKGQNESYPPIPAVLPMNINLPDGLIWDYLFSFRGSNGVWKSWCDIVRNIKYDMVIKIGSLLIPTPETARCMHMIKMHIMHKNPMILVGPSGTGKTAYIRNYFIHELPTESYWTQSVTMKMHITAKETQEIILSQMFKSGKHLYKPPEGRQCVMFIDDVNVPVKDPYGCQPAIELLREYLDYQHWFDLKESHRIHLSNILMLGAMRSLSGTQNELSPRFLSHFSVYSMSAFSDASLSKIFRTILHAELMNRNFGADIVGSVVAIVNATLKIYSDVKENLLPTPLKCHYVFNLQDISRVIEGCSLINKESVDSRRVLIRLWTHEILREFYDRLLNLHERAWLVQKINWCIKTHFKENFEVVFENLGPVKGKKVHDTLKSLLFGSALYPDVPFKSKKYEEMNFSRFQEVVENYLIEYNEVEKVKLDLIVFRYALEHLSRVCRVMTMPGGNALLIGYAHVGKLTLSRLAAALMGHKFAEPPASSSSGAKEWRDSLKRILKSAGGKSKPTVLVISEMHMIGEILSDVESLLSCGEVPNMFSTEDRLELLEMVGRRAQGSRRTVNIDPLTLYAFFVNCCKENLHLIICMRPTSPGFRETLRCYPSLIKYCTLDVYERWPEEAIEKAAVLSLGRLNLDENIKRSLVDAVVSVHISSRFLGRLYFEKTERALHFPLGSYFEFLQLCSTLIPQRKTELFSKKQRYMVGIDKLKSAAEMAVNMQKAVDEMQPELVRANEESKRMMEAIEKETEALEKASAIIKEDEIEANEKATAAQELKDDCEKDLAQVIPILEGAVQSLNTLKPADITLVKSMKNPPEAVKLVMAAVCVMMDVKPDRLSEDSSGKKITDYWGPSKKILSDMSFLQKLKDYDKHNIPPEIMAKVRKDYIKNPMFKPKKVKKASRAAEGLCKWVLAMSNFDEVEKIAAPKREKFETADREYQEINRALEEKRAKIRGLQNKLLGLKSSLEATDEHKKYLEEACKLSMLRLQRAEKLLGGLSGEESRWLLALEKLDTLIENSLGDVLLSSAFIAYLAPCDQSLRLGCVTYWKRLFKEKNIPLSKDYMFHLTMGEEIKIQEWISFGLPKDPHSVDNAVIISNSKRFCLIIDPQLLASKWIKKMESKNGLNIVKFQDPNFQSVIETSVTQGMAILIENFRGSMNPSLHPLMKQEFFSSGDRWFINVGAKTIGYNKNFRLYIISGQFEPEFIPDVYAMFAIINFSVIKESLEDQLLDVAVAMTMPQVEHDWAILVSMMDKNKKQIEKVEDNVLSLLSSVVGNILDSESAVTALDSSKVLSSELQTEFKKHALVKAEMESQRSSYKSLADHASKVYFSLDDVPTMNSMYHFSLDWFISVYKASILASIQESVKLVSVGRLSENFTYTFYCSVCRSIFDEDKLLFSFLLALHLVRLECGITAEELEFLATAGAVYTGFIPRNPAKSWLSEESWKNILRLCNLPCFKGFLAKFKGNKPLWEKIYQSQEPQKEELPLPWNKRLTDFQKLLFLRGFRPDKVKSAIEEFIKKQLGTKYLSAPGFNIAESFGLSKKASPLLMILSHGVDPLLDLIGFASSQDIHAELTTIPIGHGQDELAEDAVREAQLKGQWICLENCHLAESWMPGLENLVSSMACNNIIEEGFRLWLTSYPCEAFPPTVAQMSIKLVKEAPSGLKRNLLRSLTSGPIAESSFYANYRDKDSILRRYVFSLCFFHALVIERGKFGPIGWNEVYNFSESDLHISLKQMEVLLSEYEETPHDSIRYLVGECNYGGQVTNNQDRLTLETILFDLIHPDIEVEYYPSLTKTGPPFYLPVGGSYGDYIDFIKDLPESFGPETFGLHENADIMRVKRESKLISSKLALTLLKPDPHKRERFSGSLLDLIDEIGAKIPKSFSEVQTVGYADGGDDHWMHSVLKHEMELFTKLLATIHGSLETLRDRIQGFDSLTPEIERLGSTLLQGKIPVEWMSVSYPSLKSLGSYVNDLKVRVEFFQDWGDNGEPAEFWLSGFFNPQSLVVGSLQNYACDAKVPMSNFRLVAMSCSEGCESGLCVYGLYMEGACWDESSSSIDEAEPGVPYYEMPKVVLVPVNIDSHDQRGHYSCPLYNSPERRTSSCFSKHSSVYVASVDIKTYVAPEHWIKRGVALVCQMEEVLED